MINRLTADADDPRVHKIDLADSRICVVFDGGSDCRRLVEFGRDLATRFACPWEVLLIEAADWVAAGEPDSETSRAIGHAAALGASIHRLSGATSASTVTEYLDRIKAPHVVLAVRPRRGVDILMEASLVEQLAAALPRATFHVVRGAQQARRVLPWLASRSVPRDVVLTAVGVLLTTAMALLLHESTGATNLSILYLFPVIAASARLGVVAGAIGALLSAAMFNLFFLAPTLMFKPFAIQTWVMALVLLVLGLYTSWLTGTLHSRINLSDRNAHESAALAAFAQDLTAVADWTSTAEVVCRQIHQMFGVNAILVREIAGKLQTAGSFPKAFMLDPLDEAALQWAWNTGEITGSGSAHLTEASWQFHPLRTSLATLGILGISKGDGRDPIRPQHRILLATMVAQASLAHERLRLEDGALAPDR